MGGSSKPAETKSDVWTPQKAPLEFGYKQARSIYDAPGSRVAPFSPFQVEAQTGLANLARNMIPSLGQPLTSAYSRALGASDVSNNPALPGLISGAIRPVSQALTEQWLPSIRYNFLGGDSGFNSSKRGIGEGIAVGRAADAASDATAKIMSGAYDSGLRASIDAMGLTPNILAGLTSPYSILGGVGGEQQTMAQSLLDEPSARLAEYMRTIGPPAMGTAQTGASGGGGALSGALGAGGLAGALMTPAFLASPAGWAALAASMAAGGLAAR